LLDATVAIVEAVDRGVELVVRPHRLQQKSASRALDELEFVDTDLRLTGRRSEGAGVSRAVRQHESVVVLESLVEVVEARDDLLDVVADGVVVRLESG